MAANRFGGAKIGFGVSFNAVAIPRANVANGEGMRVNALNPKSATRKSANHAHPVSSVINVIKKICVATSRTTFSSTWFLEMFF